MPPKDTEVKNTNQPLTYRQLQDINLKYFPNLGDIKDFPDYENLKNKGYSNSKINRIRKDKLFEEAFSHRKDYDKLRQMNNIQRDNYYIQAYYSQNDPQKYVQLLKELYPNKANELDTRYAEIQKQQRIDAYNNANPAQKRELVEQATQDLLSAEATLTSSSWMSKNEVVKSAESKLAGKYLERFKEYPSNIQSLALANSGYISDDIQNIENFSKVTKARNSQNAEDYIVRQDPVLEDLKARYPKAYANYGIVHGSGKEFSENKILDRAKWLYDSKQPLTNKEAEVYNKWVEDEAERLFGYEKTKKDIESRNIIGDITTTLLSGGVDYDDITLEKIAQAQNKYILSHSAIPYTQNGYAYGTLTEDNFKQVVKQLCPEYDKYGGSKWAPENEINYPALYEELKDEIKAGQVGYVQDYLTEHIESILSKNQAGWVESGDDLLPSKREVFFRQAAGKLAESVLNVFFETASVPVGLYGTIVGENFNEFQSLLPNVSHNIYEYISGGENSRIFSSGTLSDIIADNGATFGAFAALGLELAVAKKIPSMFLAPTQADKVTKILDTYLLLESGFDEASGDAFAVRDDILKQGITDKAGIIENKYNEFINNYDSNRPYNANRAEEIFTQLFSQQGGKLFDKLKSQYTNAEQIGFIPSDAQINHQVNEILKEYAIAQAQAEEWFEVNNQDYDEYVRHQANTAYGRTLLQEALIVNLSTLFGLGIEARFMPTRLIKPSKWPLVNKLTTGLLTAEDKLIKSGRIGRGIVSTEKAARKTTSRVLGEYLEELGQGQVSGFQQKRGEQNVENYAKGLYYGVGADLLTAQELGFLQGLTDIGPEAWKEVDKEDLFKSTALSTLLLGRFHRPSKGKSSQQIHIDNTTKIGEVFDYIRKYTPYQSVFGDILEESKAEVSERLNIAKNAFENFYNDDNTTKIRQSIASTINIGAQMIKAAEEGNVDEYQTKKAAYQASLAIMLNNLNEINPKHAKSYLELIQKRANIKNLNDSEQEEVLQHLLSDASTNDLKSLSRDEQIDFISDYNQTTLDLIQKVGKIKEKFKDIESDNIDIRPLIFAELLSNLAPKVINENWNQLSSSIDKVITDNSSSDSKFNTPAYQWIINNYFKEQDFNKRLDNFVDIINGKVKDFKKEDITNAFNDIMTKLSMEVPNAESIVKSDSNLIKWRSEVYKEWNDIYDKALKGEGVIPEEELNKIHKEISTDAYRKKFVKEINKRRKNISDLVRFLDAEQNNIDNKQHEPVRNEIYTALEEKNPDVYKNVTKALEIIQTANNIKDVLKETALNNKEIQKVYERLEQIVDLAKENVKEASDLLNIGSYSGIINDPSGILQGYLTDILSDINQQSEVPEVESPVVESEPVTSDPNEHKPKVDSAKTRNRVKQHRKTKKDIKKAEEAALAEQEKVEEEFQYFNNDVASLLDQFDNNEEQSIDQLQRGLADIQRLMDYANSRDFCCYISKTLLDGELDVLKTLEENILIKLAKAVYNESLKQKEKTEPKKDKDLILDELNNTLEQLIKLNEKKGKRYITRANVRQSGLESLRQIYEKYKNDSLTEEQKKVFNEIAKYYEVKPKEKSNKEKNEKETSVKKLKISDFNKMKDRIISILNEFKQQKTQISEEMIRSYLWNDEKLNGILTELFGTKENFDIFYDTVKDFEGYRIDTIDDIKFIINQVILSNLYGITPSEIQVSDLLDRLTYDKLEEIFGTRSVKTQHEKAINIVTKKSSGYYDSTIDAYKQLYEEVKNALNNKKQLVLSEAPDDCKLTITINNKKVPLIISKAQAEKDDSVSDSDRKYIDTSLLFKDDKANEELPVETGERINYSDTFQNSINILSGIKRITQLERAIKEEAFQFLLNAVEKEISPYIGPIVNIEEEYPIVVELDGVEIPYITNNMDYKTNDIIVIDTDKGLKAGKVLYYGLPNNIDEFEAKATSLDKVVVTPKEIPDHTPKKLNVKIIHNALREGDKSTDTEDYSEVKNRIDFEWLNEGNVNIGDNIGFVVYTWNSKEGPRRIIYYTTERQEDGSYHILGVLDQGSYSIEIDKNSSIGKLISRIREADNGVDGYYYQEEGWKVNKVSYNSANPTNKKLSFEEGNLNKVLDEENGIFGIKQNGKVERVILVKHDKTGFVSTDPNFTQDTLLNSNPNSERNKSTRVASNREGGAMRENSPLLVVPTTDGYEALNNVRALDPKVDGYMDIIRKSLLSGKVGEMFKNDILQRISDLFRNTRNKGIVEKPAPVSLAKFFKTNNQALVISSDNANTFSIYITSPDGKGGTSSSLLATISYPADINFASKEDSTTKELILSAQFNIVNGSTGEITTTIFDNIYKVIINNITNETSPVINSVNINFEQIKNNPEILDALIADGLLWSNSIPLNSKGKIKRAGAEATANNTKEDKKIAIVVFEDNPYRYSYNIEGLDVQIGDNVEPRFGGSQGKVINVMSVPEYEQYREENNITDKWTPEEVLKQPKSKFIDRHTKTSVPAPVITASTTEYTPNISNNESVNGNIPNPVSIARKKKLGNIKSTEKTPEQQESSTEQSSSNKLLPSENSITENIFKYYEQITDESIIERLDEIGVTEEQWNNLDPFARERLITCGKW